jgi:hypothetical protein
MRVNHKKFTKDNCPSIRSLWSAEGLAYLSPTQEVTDIVMRGFNLRLVFRADSRDNRTSSETTVALWPESRPVLC